MSEPRVHATQSERVPTHVCMDCGELGHAGGYHDHGNGDAGDTFPLSRLPAAIERFRGIEDERDELLEVADRYREALGTIGTDCENYTGDTTCVSVGRTRGGQYTAEAWCVRCIARVALDG